MKADSRKSAIPSPKSRWERMQKGSLTLAQLLELLNNAKLAEGKSQKTCDWYEKSIEGYAKWLERQQQEPTLANFTLHQVRAYLVALQNQAAFEFHPTCATKDHVLSDHSINSIARALRAFSNWLCDESYTAEPVLARLLMPKVSKKVADILCAEEIADIVTSLNPRTEIGARDQAIFLLLLDSGMRAGELCGLRLDDLHLEQGYAMVFGKGKKQRPVKIGARAAKAVRFYLLHWRKPATENITHVFLTCRGGVKRDAEALTLEPGIPLSVNALGHIIKRIGKAAGVPRLHPHLLRHTFACMYLMRHRDPFALKSMLGHTTLAMTNHYCEAVQQMDVVKADAVSVIDSLDLRALDVNRRGRPAKKQK